MPVRPPHRRPIARVQPAGSLWRRLALERRGAVAVEFALVAPIFLLLTFGAIQVAAALYAQSALEVAAQRAHRMATVNTAYGQTEAFLSVFCQHLTSMLLNCADVRILSLGCDGCSRDLSYMQWALQDWGVNQSMDTSDSGPGGPVITYLEYRPPFIVPFVSEAIIGRVTLTEFVYSRRE